MRQGLVVFGLVLIAVGIGMLVLSGNFLTRTETEPGPFGIGQTQQTEGISYGIPPALAWVAITAGAIVTLAGLSYDTMKRGVRAR